MQVCKDMPKTGVLADVLYEQCLFKHSSLKGHVQYEKHPPYYVCGWISPLPNMYIHTIVYNTWMQLAGWRYCEFQVEIISHLGGNPFHHYLNVVPCVLYVRAIHVIVIFIIVSYDVCAQTQHWDNYLKAQNSSEWARNKLRFCSTDWSSACRIKWAHWPGYQSNH